MTNGDKIRRVMAQGRSAHITREQVEKMRGKWKICNNLWNGCTPDYDCVCSMCKKSGAPNMDFCPSCGAPMTNWSVDILWKRLEAMHNAD